MRNVPPQVLPPIIQKADPDATPIMSIVLSSTSMSLRTLTEIADKQVKRVLESVDGVGEVTMSGGQPREIHIVVDIEKLNAHGLSIDQVRDAIQAENVEVPGGRSNRASGKSACGPSAESTPSDQFKNIIVKTVNGAPIRISDIGYAEDSTAKRTSAQFLADGNPAIQLDIRRASGENTIEVTGAVKVKLRRFSRRCQRRDSRRDERRFRVHQRLGHIARGASALGQPARVAHRRLFHAQRPGRDHLGAGDSRVDHRDVYADAGHGLHAEQHDVARPHARRRHRHRRCDRGAREHFPVRRREGRQPVRGGDSGDA
jgi:hypothetical protein